MGNQEFYQAAEYSLLFIVADYAIITLYEMSL